MISDTGYYVFPGFDPVAIDLGIIQIRWYALAYIAGILLALAGTIVGAFAVVAMHPVLRSLLPASLPHVGEVEASAWLLAFALGVAALVTVLVALGPALSASFVQGLDRLLRGARGASAGRGTPRWSGRRPGRSGP